VSFPVVLGVDGDKAPELRALLHPLVESQVVGGLEVLDAGERHERLEADCPALGELVEPADVAGNEPGPEAKVYERRPLGHRELRTERHGVQRRRRVVQRHVTVGGDAARRESRGPCLEALPMRAAGVVEMHVYVDATGEDVETVRVNLLPRPAGDLLRYLDDLSVSDRVIRRADAIGADASRV
jgi:hypothetical protein